MQNLFVSSTLIDADFREGVDIDDNTISSMRWWNGRVGYQDELANGATWSVNLNITNLFDREPPVVPGSQGFQIFDDQFDVFGRRYNLSANYSF